MGLFDKKFCDVCGEKIGLLGNRKLEDGNLCKDCAKKLSPFFSERKQSTVAEIKEQLAYREENERRLSSFRPTRTFGDGMKVYIDEAAGNFIVSRMNDWKSGNPDIIALSQVTSANLDISENRRELYYEDNDGNEQSYVPPRYEYEYDFNVVINVNSPWFSQIKFELNPSRKPDSRYTELYREFERTGNELCSALMRQGVTQHYYYEGSQYAAAPEGMVYNTAQPVAPGTVPFTAPVRPQPVAFNQQSAPAGSSWICQSCGTGNTGKFCQSCGAQKPAVGYRCDKCGWTPAPGQSVPRFCPQCGDPFDGKDAL